MHRNRIRKVATGAVALLALALTLQTGGASSAEVSADALKHPQKAEKAPDATAASQSSTPLGAPPADQQAKPENHGQDDKVKKPDSKPNDNEENSNPTSTKSLTYRGGAVQSTPRVYLVFWGPNWFNGGDPYGVANRLHYLYQGLSQSGWANVLKQYGSNYGTFSNPASQYRGWIQDTTPVPSRPTSTDMANAASRAALRMGDVSYLAQYVIATPWGVVDQYSLSAGACAWHSWVYPNGSNWVTYTSMPYTPYLDSSIYNCGGNSVNGSNGRLDGVTIVAGHEYAESVNDPGLNAWKDSDGSENADKCAWRNLANRPLANGYTFAMQPTWSNTWRTQYGYGCYYSG